MPRRALSRKASSRKVSRKKKVTIASPVTGKGSYKVGRTYKGSGKYKAGPLESLGSSIGGWAGRKLGSITGTGDYMLPDGSQVLAPEPPMMVKDQYGTVITHREYLGDLISSSSANTFKVQTWGLNPGDPGTFPWLSTVVKESFQQYHFEQLMFEYRTFSSDALNSTNTSLGSVFACINYDYNDPDLLSRYEIENTDWSRAVKPSQSMLIPVECDPKQTGLNGGLLYVLNGNNPPAGSDPKTYYLGKLFLGSTGVQGTNVNLGSLYVTYRVRILKPMMTRPLSSANIFTVARTTYDNSNLFGTIETANSNHADSLDVTFSGNVMTINKYRLKNGMRFLLSVTWQGTTAVAYAQPTITHSGGFGLNYFAGFGLPYVWAPFNGVSTAQVLLNNVFVVTDANQDLTITLGGSPSMPTGTNYCHIVLAQICGTPLDQIGNFDA